MITHGKIRASCREDRPRSRDDIHSDACGAALGVATSIRGILRAIQPLSNSGRTLIELLLRVFPTAQLGLWIIVGADLVRARIWEHAADQGVWMRVLNPYVDIVAAPSTAGCRWTRLLSLPGMFAILAVGLAGVVIALGTALSGKRNS